MGGIIAALTGIALVIGSIMLRRHARKAALVSQAKADETKGKAGSERDLYAHRDLRKQAESLTTDAKAARWLARACILGVLGGLVILASTIVVTVPTRNVGVTTAFGRTTGTLANGLHVTWPWEAVTIYDATVQTPAADKLPTFDVRIANEAVATMRVSLEWQLQEGVDITKIHMDWRGFDSLEGRVVNTRLADALNKTFRTFDPLLSLRQKEGTPVTVATLEPVVRQRLQEDLPAGIIIKRLQIPFVQYPPAVQKALDDMQKELAATQVALQQQKTAEAQKLAIEILASAKMTPEAFAQQCLIVTERMALAGHQASMAWSCVPSSFGLAVSGRQP